MISALIGYFIGLYRHRLPLLSWLLISALIIWVITKYPLKNVLLVIGFFILGSWWGQLKNPAMMLDDHWTVVTTRGASYVIVWDAGDFYYIDVEEHPYEVGDILLLSGKKSTLIMNHYESRFDYGGYLNGQGVEYEIKIHDIRRLWTYPFSSIRLVTNWLPEMPIKTQEILSAFLWDDIQSHAVLIQQSKLLGFSFYFSQSGVLLYGLEKLLQTIIRLITKKEAPSYVRKIYYFFFLLLNPFSVVILRRFFRDIVPQVNQTTPNESLTKTLFIFLIFNLFSRYIVYNWSFIIYFVIFACSWISRMLQPYMHAFFRPLILPLFISFFFGVMSSFSNGLFSPFQALLGLTLLPLIILLILFAVFTSIFPFLIGSVFFVEQMLIRSLYFLSFFNLQFYLGTQPLFWVIFVSLGFLFLGVLQFQSTPLMKPILFIMLFLFVMQTLPYEHLYETQVSFINVGQGDAILLRHRNSAWLIDTGGQLHFDIAQECLIPFLHKQKVTHLDGVIITHQDFDHMGGYASLNERFSIGQLIESSDAFPLMIGQLKLTNLNSIRHHDDDNIKSLILYFKIQDTNFLLMGDAGVENEAQIMKEQPNLSVNVIKIGHHGSNTSTSSAFLDFVKPTTAIISAARLNRYGHPHDDVINRLVQRDIQIRSTMDEGTITYKFYGFV